MKNKNPSLKTFCKKCGGKCCNGSRFNYVLIQNFEVEQLRALGAKIQRNVPFSEMIIRQNKDCQFLENGRCSIYEYRPLSCKRYDCRGDMEMNP